MLRSIMMEKMTRPSKTSPVFDAGKQATGSEIVLVEVLIEEESLLVEVVIQDRKPKRESLLPIKNSTAHCIKVHQVEGAAAGPVLD